MVIIVIAPTWAGATACHDMPHPSVDPFPLLRQPAHASADKL
jgi:hypothetical protein